MADAATISIKLDRRQLDAVLRRGMALGPVAAKAIERIYVAIGKRIASQRAFTTRSGQLARAWQPKASSLTVMRTRSTATTARGDYGPRVKYARIQEHGSKDLPGGVVRAKNAKNLAIPLKAAKTARGIARKKSPRDYPEGFLKFAIMNDKKFWVEAATGRPYYKLQPTVKIKGTHAARNAVRATRARAAQIANATIAEALSKVVRDAPRVTAS